MLRPTLSFFFFFNDTATTEIYTLSLHDALPISDRTLFFDFLPLDLGTISGFTTKFQLYTVPGQVYSQATRRLVLQGADGVVFVADSQSRQLEENIESFQDRHANLSEQGVDPRGMPLVVQYNKQDLPKELILPVPELSEAINFRGS